MSSMPADITHGYVIGQFLTGVADGPDGGRLPDVSVPTGLKPMFTPASPVIKTATAVVVAKKIECTVDAEGYLLDPAGERGVWLIAGVWKVTYSGVSDLVLPAHDINVATGHTEESPLDLVNALPAGTPIVPSQYAELVARDAVQLGRIALLEEDAGGNAVESVNGETGAVVLDAAAVGASPEGHGHTSAAITDWTEAVQDTLAGFFNVTGASVSYNDAGDQMIITVPPDTNTTDPEAVRDAIGAAIVALGNLNVAIDDAGNTITLTTTATVNSTDAALRDRGTHTGSQAIATITGLQAALDGKAPRDTYIVSTVPTPNDTTVGVPITGLSIPPLADGLYEFDVRIIGTAATATTGAQITMISASGAQVVATMIGMGASSGAAPAWRTAASNIVTSKLLGISSSDGGGGSPAAQIQGTIRALSMTESIVFLVGSEVAGSLVTALPDSVIRVRRIGN